MAHGVRPPLTATAKRPRAATAARASAAMYWAARRATDSTSARTSIFITPGSRRLRLRLDGIADQAELRDLVALVPPDRRAGIDGAEQLRQHRDQTGPAGLVAGADAGAVVAMEV